MEHRTLTLNSLHVDCSDDTLRNYLRDLGAAPISVASPSDDQGVEAWASQDGCHIISRSKPATAGAHPRTKHIVLKTSNIGAFNLPTRRDPRSGLLYAITQHPALPDLRWIVVDTGNVDYSIEYDSFTSAFYLDTICAQLAQISASSVLAFDHLACAVEEGQALPVAEWLMDVLGFHRHRGVDEEEQGQLVMMGEGALRMVTVRHGDFYVVLAESVEGYAGQIRDFLDAHGPGVQHIALKASDIVQLAQNARATGRIDFAVPPESAWENALTDAAGDREMLALVIARKNNRILTKVKMESGRACGLLSQLFTARLSDQTQLFLELIERHNFDGFAAANINSLFASQHVDQSILFVDETLGAEVLSQWAATSTNLTAAITMLQCKTEDDLLQYLKHTAKYFTTVVSSFVPLTAPVFDALIRAPVLVCAQGSGFNHIDLEECRKRDIGVCNNAGWCSTEVAEHTFACLISLANGSCFLKDGSHWDRKASNKRTLHGSTIGLIGCGDIGRRVIPLVRAFGMNVQIYDPAAGHDEISLATLLATSDYVSLHAPLTKSTYHMICDETMALMKPGSCIINTARGGLIDEDALVRALEHGRTVRAAALDVFEVEPLPLESKLWNMPRVLLSPHVAGLTETATAKAGNALIKNLEALSKGEGMDSVLVASSVVSSYVGDHTLGVGSLLTPTPSESGSGSDGEQWVL
ncbi:hypothetical protein HKX48_000720 [Thoreauomyces humboldtii]|nr:hypothetical protein HKX48_000720 [Thoreauomyces humboldtii]